MKKLVKRMIKGIAVLSITALISGPALAAMGRNPAEEGAKDAYSLLGKSAEDAAEKTASAAEAVTEKTSEAAENAVIGIKKSNQKITEGGARAWEAMTQEKVQAGLSGGLAVGLPAGGVTYLVALAAGASNPAVAAIVATAAVGGVVGARTAQHYENTHEQ